VGIMERTDFKQDCLIVLGMHRSGTSAMACVVNLLGAEIGGNLLAAVPNNPKGFWEHCEILELNRRLHKEIGKWPCIEKTLSICFGLFIRISKLLKNRG